MTAMPRYRTDPSPPALATRLRALRTAGVPVACRVYGGLSAPVATSALHARITHAQARAFVAGESAAVPRFEPPPSARQRLLTVASWGRLDGAGPDMTTFPVDLASELWWRVHERARGPLRVPERRLACDLLLRLGYPQQAASVIGLAVIDPRRHVLSPGLAVEELAVLRCHLPSSAVEAMALRGARSGLPAEARRDLALFVLFRTAARGADSTSMRAAAALATKASAELPRNGFAAALQRARLHRAIAAVPFVRRDISETHRLLGRALESLHTTTPGSAEVDGLAWADEAYALHCFLVRTHLAVGLGQRAIGYAAELAELSPGDDRTWALQGDAFAACGQLEAALEAYGKGVALGGWGAARAAYLRGFVLDQLGRVAEAAEDYVLSQRIDPTSSVVPGPEIPADAGRDRWSRRRADLVGVRRR
ncbi:tetratricopeptide repeat protein [Lentzea sp. CC55]|uniref:tetratricopeptide repeat protein n=1 Tax=Lentzea sp. CC55 TaxID=2884909 RepID=UPI001F2ECF8C|nr:tetratricopeptide repeat protein [Lentzea sp. CC55]MCG8926016.1 tetratricopeptide repeat protein [Lentzea sp. CC55]